MQGHAIKVKIKAEVTAWIYADSIEEIRKRNVDIYLHGAGENGHLEKEDLGADRIEITEAH